MEAVGFDGDIRVLVEHDDFPRNVILFKVVRHQTGPFVGSGETAIVAAGDGDDKVPLFEVFKF